MGAGSAGSALRAADAYLLSENILGVRRNRAVGSLDDNLGVDVASILAGDLLLHSSRNEDIALNLETLANRIQVAATSQSSSGKRENKTKMGSGWWGTGSAGQRRAAQGSAGQVSTCCANDLVQPAPSSCRRRRIPGSHQGSQRWNGACCPGSRAEGQKFFRKASHTTEREDTVRGQAAGNANQWKHARIL